MAARSSKKNAKSRPLVSPEVITFVSIVLTIIVGYFIYVQVTSLTAMTNTSEASGIYYMCGNSCTRADTRRRRPIVRVYNGDPWEITCQRQPGTSRYVWTCEPQ